jgi:hypothetical protein
MTFREFLIEAVDHSDMEEKVISALKAAGYAVEPASWDEKRNQGVDAWVSLNNQKTGIRIKAGARMNEVPVVAMLGWTPERFAAGKPMVMDGPDMHSKASVWVNLDSSGQNLLLSNMDEVRRVVTDSVRRMQETYNGRALRRVVTKQGEARIVTDPATQDTKVVVYVRPWDLHEMPVGMPRRVKLVHGLR